VALIAEFVGGAAATAMAVVRSRMKSDASFFWRTSCGTACEELAGPEPPPPASVPPRSFEPERVSTSLGWSGTELVTVNEDWRRLGGWFLPQMSKSLVKFPASPDGRRA